MTIKLTLSAALLASVLTGCTTRAAQLSCDDLAEQAKAASQTQGTPVTRFTDVREQSATETEKVCTATAEVAGGATTSVVVRGYEQDGQQKVEFHEAPAS